MIQYPLHKSSRSFTTPASLKIIRKKAFAGNSYLHNLTVQADQIGSRSFADMEGLRSVTLSSKVVKVGYRAFYSCDKLTTIKNGDSIKKIGDEAFCGTNIRSFYVPSGLQKLGSDAFLDCNNLARFTGNGGSKYSVEDDVLYGSNKSTLIKYPEKKATESIELRRNLQCEKSPFHRNLLTQVKLGFRRKRSRLR